MSERVRQFTAAGNEAFQQFLGSLRAQPVLPLATALLSDPALTTAVPFEAFVEREPHGRAFANRFEFGQYLNTVLAGVERSQISLNSGLWNWLALFYFDQLCPAGADGKRDLRAEAVYFLPSRYKHNRYYRHLVRSPWLAFALHGEKSRVLLVPISSRGVPLALTGEIFEQVAGRQGVFRSARTVATIYDLYFDEAKGRPRSGTGGRGRGSPNRLGIILKQFELTFDLDYGSGALLTGLLPSEFTEQ
jgi:hypothetical protein